MRPRKVAKIEVTDYARSLIKEMDSRAHIEQSDYVQTHTSAQLHCIEIICIRMNWTDLDKEITTWRDAREAARKGNHANK